MKYLAIREMHETENFSVKWMCGVLNINRGAYYKWLKRKVPEKEQEDMQIAQYVLEYNEKTHGILGYRRMRIWINREHHTNYGLKRIRRIMRILDLKAVIRRTRHSCTIGNKADQKAENILGRDFVADAPNKKWLTDVSEFKVPESTKKIYLSAFMDLYDRSIVVWVISDRNDNKLVFDTFNQAIKANPEAQPLFHSDRGFQYTSPAFKHMLEQQGMEQSMSRVGCCIDNGPQEALWGIIKTEMYELYDIHDKSSLIQAIGDYMDFYNNRRYQERFDSKTPMEVRMEAIQTDNPKQYPIAPNPRIEKYNQHLEDLKRSSQN